MEDEIKNKKVSAEKAILNASASFEETLTKTLGAAKKVKIPVSVCGEAASDASMAKKLVEMGFDALSVSISNMAD